MGRFNQPESAPAAPSPEGVREVAGQHLQEVVGGVEQLRDSLPSDVIKAVDGQLASDNGVI